MLFWEGARERVGHFLAFDELVDTMEQCGSGFRPPTPALETKPYVIWKKYQVLSLAAEIGSRTRIASATQRGHGMLFAIPGTDQILLT